MTRTEIAVVGAGPAGMSAAITAARQGAQVLLIDRSTRLGGQLVKQTHRFFGSNQEYAGTRGFEIARILEKEVRSLCEIEVMEDATVLGLYHDRVLVIEHQEQIRLVTAEKFIIATGAMEKMLAFPNNDLPGIYGAGAVQTFMNVHGVLPGRNIVMVGAGNIGLIISYQLAQAGATVKAIVEAAPEVGGYRVHAAKVRRIGIPVLTSHTVKAAYGTESIEAVKIVQLGQDGRPRESTEKVYEVDALCLAVGLSPLNELLWQVGCQMRYVPELGGYVPVRSSTMETSVPGVYVAGDVAGVEEASSAILEGQVAGLAAADALGYGERYEELKAIILGRLADLRAGPTAQKILNGLARVVVEEERAWAN